MKKLFILFAVFISINSHANGLDNIPALTITNTNAGQEYSVSLQILAIMTLLSFIPAIIILMTSFTRVAIVLTILRQATGLGSTPSNQIIMGLSLFLTLFIMNPIFTKVYEHAIDPYVKEEINMKVAFSNAIDPFYDFMLLQVRKKDLEMFLNIAGKDTHIKKKEDLPLRILVPAFVTSELKTAFQIGFMIFIPFLIIDLVVASILMAMGMMMLSPMIVSLPFKLMLFVLIDGWSLVMGTLASSFY